MELLAWEAGKLAGWEDMVEYDQYVTFGFQLPLSAEFG
jgi:hypothetical protein